MAKNLILDLILACLDQIWVPHFFFFCGFYFYLLLEIVPSYHPRQFKGKLKNKTWENGKKTNLRPNFGQVGLNLGPQNFFCRFYFY